MTNEECESCQRLVEETTQCRRCSTTVCVHCWVAWPIVANPPSLVCTMCWLAEMLDEGLIEVRDLADVFKH